MITLDEAKETTLLVKGDTYRLHTLLEKLYEERGRCDQCIHIGELKLYCIKMQQMTPPDGYCHMYEKDEEDD